MENMLKQIAEDDALFEPIEPYPTYASVEHACKIMLMVVVIKSVKDN